MVDFYFRYAKVNDLKKQNPQLKTLLATGGWNAGSKPFSDMVATRTNRSEFVTSTIEFLRQRDFDGLDIDWEYPAKRGGRPEDKARLVLLLQVRTMLVVVVVVVELMFNDLVDVTAVISNIFP